MKGIAKYLQIVISRHYYKSWSFLLRKLVKKDPKVTLADLTKVPFWTKLILTMSILTSGLFDYLYLVILISKVIDKNTNYLTSK